ncbi:MAG: OsmC family protein [Bacteroidota bacterium]
MRVREVAHEYRATVKWKREGNAKFTDQRYSRGHTISFDGGITVPGSSSPLSVRLPYSVAEAVDPEEALVASVSSCHMLTFLYVAAKQGFVIDAYEDSAVGEMTKNERGVPFISAVTLNPRIVYGGDKRPSPEELAHLHHESHEQCFIAQSVTTVVTVNDPPR